MGNMQVDVSKYIHTYEAYRIPKGEIASAANNSQGGTSENEGDQLILTDAAKKQLLQDRADYASAMMEERRRLSSEQHEEAVKKYTEDQAKIIAVFRSMASGKRVSDTDEKKLMEYDSNLYQSAKMAQMMAQRAEEEKESHFNEQEDEDYNKKMESYHEKMDEMRRSWNEEFDGFIKAQGDAVVEVSADNVNISSISAVVNLGGGIAGAIFDRFA